MNENKEVLQALQHNVEMVRMLKERIEILERPVEDNVARLIAVMSMLRAM